MLPYFILFPHQLLPLFSNPGEKNYLIHHLYSQDYLENVLGDWTRNGLNNHVIAEVPKPVYHFLCRNRSFRQCSTPSVNSSHASFARLLISDKMIESLISVCICRPSRMPHFSSLRDGNMAQIYLRLSPSLFSALSNCFMSPSVMFSGVKTMSSWETNASRKTFLTPTLNSFMEGHPSLGQWFFLLWLSHKQRKHGY